MKRREPRRFDNLKTPSPQFKATIWLGFTSGATQSTVYSLNNIRLDNR
jgi:hypothetical protein